MFVEEEDIRHLTTQLSLLKEQTIQKNKKQAKGTLNQFRPNMCCAELFYTKHDPFFLTNKHATVKHIDQQSKILIKVL